MEQRICYWIVQSTLNEAGNPTVALVKENEGGYYPTDFDWGDYETARKIANQLNAEVGITEEEAAEIVASSMAAQPRRGMRAR